MKLPHKILIYLHSCIIMRHTLNSLNYVKKVADVESEIGVKCGSLV